MALKNSSVKRKRTLEESDDVFKPSKAPSITLTTTPNLSISSTSSFRAETPRLPSTFTAKITPASAPPAAAAGRSPKSSKRVGILSRSRRGLSRMDSPSFGAKARNAAPQLSLAAALNGTLAYAKPAQKLNKHVTTIEESIPKSWEFAIHEDTPEEEMVNMVHHSTCTLDISDDESRRTKDERGKENIPPVALTLTGAAVNQSQITLVAPSRKDAMTDDARTPLGDLNPKDFYAAGCDATTFITVPADDKGHEPSSIANILASPKRPSNEFTVECKSSSASLLRKAELDALISGALATPSTNQNNQTDNDADNEEDAATDIEIWESGSANEDIDEERGIEDSIFAV